MHKTPPDERHDDDVIVYPDPGHQDAQSNGLAERSQHVANCHSIPYRRPVEVVLHTTEEGSVGCQERDPDEDDPQLVEDGSGGGVQLLCHCDPGPVEDGDGAHVSQGPDQQPVVVLIGPLVALVTSEDHHEGVNSVLKPEGKISSDGCSGLHSESDLPSGPRATPSKMPDLSNVMKYAGQRRTARVNTPLIPSKPTTLRGCRSYLFMYFCSYTNWSPWKN